ncbi:class I SAM-dependent methyltransferase [Embleya sp. NPDC020630]|uniref:class I SAM-dependent methyltransferase n=1 Tax=Embleya sp. NPDC020630 TaxID=3363979 RepID=UPI0037B35AF2
MSTRNLLTDTPELYERRFPDPGRLAARWTDATLRRHGGGPRVLDVGCGTGRDAAWLHAHAAREVVGIDTSAAMVRHARTHHPGPDYRLADMRDFDLGRVFDAVVCLDSALLYCHENAELAAFLDRCREHLVPGGLFVAELRNGAYFLQGAEGSRPETEPRTDTVVRAGVTYTSRTTLWVDHGAQLLRRRREWTSDDGAPARVQLSAWRLLFPRELDYFLDVAGFDVLDLYDRPGPRTDPPWVDGAPPAATGHGDRLHVVARRR